MAKREFLQLAHTIAPKHNIGGWWWSFKLDGCRCFWDGGISRGILKSDVPYANTAKDERYLDAEVATGLWSRYGNVIHAPEWWLNTLPPMPLDGELWAGLDVERQDLRSWISKLIPIDEEWIKVGFHVFDMPPISKVLADGFIDNTNFKKRFKGCVEWWDRTRMSAGINCLHDPHRVRRYETASELLDQDYDVLEQSRTLYWQVHDQHELPLQYKLAWEVINTIMANLGRHEGIIVRNPNATYYCERSHMILKKKPDQDAEGTVVGYITGREGKEGKLLGKMGALILKLDNGGRLELSGFTDEERKLEHVRTKEECDKDISEYVNPGNGAFMPSDKKSLDAQVQRWAIKNPEIECPAFIHAPAFPRGCRVTFKYRTLTKDGIPQEARYWRKWDE